MDGVVDATDFSYGRSNLVLNSTCVGALYRASASLFLTGSVDELAIWNRALTWTEIQQIRTNGVPPPEQRIPPTITQEPSGSTNVLGDRVTLAVVVTGSLPLSYQWLKDGTAVPNETNSALTLFLTVPATNDYSVVITNIAGSTNSAPAHLVVLPDPAASLATGLVNHWPLDIVNDQAGPSSPDVANHNDLLLEGLDSSFLAPGEFGNGLTFGGAQYAQRTGGFPIYLTTNYTVSLWVNGYPQTDNRVYAEGYSGNNLPLFTIGTDNSATPSASADVFIRMDGGVAPLNHRKTTRAVFDGSWHHLVWVDENGQARMFVDGVLDETSFAYTRGRATLDTTAIGGLLRATAGNFFSGSIDEVAVWNRRLSWTEIDQLQTSPAPPSVPATAPVVFSQPADVTNYVFAQTSFTVLASGTGPLHYQWLKDGVPIPGDSNPTATNNVLTFTNVLDSAAAGGYWAIITNAQGSATSHVAYLTLLTDALKLDVDQANSPNVQPGFTEVTLAAPSISQGGITVTFSAVGGISLTDRNRITSPLVTNSPPFLTQAQLYNDFIFANNNTTTGTGVDILVEHLLPNTPYAFTLWSFDPQSTGARQSDWTEIASGTVVPITSYSFDGSVLPTDDYQDTLGGLLTSSSGGRLEVQGLKTGGNFTVFVNALRLEANPPPTSEITRAWTDGSGFLLLKVTGRYPGQVINFEQNTNLVSGVWVPAVNGNTIEVNGMVTTVAFPASEEQLFYRAVSQPVP